MTLLTIMFSTLALLLMALALWLQGRAAHRERIEEAIIRVRALGGEASGREAQDAPRHHPLVWAVLVLLWRSGVDMQPLMVRRGLISSPLLLLIAILMLGPALGVAVLLGLLAALYLVLLRRAERRRAELRAQLPAFLEALTRILGTGTTLEEALSSAAADQPEPLRALFLSIGRQVRLGAPVEEVLAEAAEVQNLRDLRVLALATAISRRYGGSLRAILRSLTSAIHAQAAAARELRALTAETRFSARVLAIIPIALTLYILVQNPGYYTDMWSQPSGRFWLLFSVLLQVTGVIVLWRMVRSTGGSAR